MKSVKIANCDLDASEISLGCMRISQMTNPDIVTLIHTALDAGINFFDHADIYGGGQSEAKFAEALGMTPQLAAIDMTNVNVQSLVVEAALTGKREHIYHAAMLDPHTAAELSLDQIHDLVDDLIAAHGSWLPEYH